MLCAFVAASGPKENRANMRWAQMKIPADLKELPNGLRVYEVKAATGGDAIAKGKKCQVMYKLYLRGAGGRITPGQHIYSQDTPADAFQYVHGTNSVIPGFEQLLEGMHSGGRKYAILPWKVGYGEQGNPGAGIPPKSDLVYFIEVVHVGDEFKAPEADPPFKVEMDLAKLEGGASGKVVIQIHPDWAPLGASRLKEMIEAKFLDNCRFFRVINGFMGQFGIHGDPEVAKKWGARRIKDDAKPKSGVSNKKGILTFAMAGPNTRTTQLFLNFRDNSFLDSQGFNPIGEVVEGMDLVDKIFKVGEGAPSGPGPAQDKIQTLGNKYLDEKFPKLSYIKSARLSTGK